MQLTQDAVMGDPKDYNCAPSRRCSRLLGQKDVGELGVSVRSVVCERLVGYRASNRGSPKRRSGVVSKGVAVEN